MLTLHQKWVREETNANAEGKTGSGGKVTYGMEWMIAGGKPEI